MFFEDIISLDCPHTKSMLKVLFEERGVRVKKQWGQNFLIDQNLLQFIVKTAALSRDDIVLEIGAGTGSLTRLIAKEAGHVFAVELDRKLFEILNDTLKEYNNVTTINKDILKSKHYINTEILDVLFDYIKNVSLSDTSHVKVISNLPYYVSTPIIIDLLQEVLPIKTMILMLQRETTNRMTAQPGTKNYGVLSVMVKLYADVKVLKKLPPDVFWPVPNVDSSIVSLTVDRNRYACRIRDYKSFKNIIHAIYVSRRKTILNSLLSLCLGRGRKDGSKEMRNDLVAILGQVGIRLESRGEELGIDALIDLSNMISDYMLQKKQIV